MTKDTQKIFNFMRLYIYVFEHIIQRTNDKDSAFKGVQNYFYEDKNK